MGVPFAVAAWCTSRAGVFNTYPFATPPVEDVSAADKILDVVADRHDECPVFSQGSSSASVSRGHHLWASVLGIRSPMMPKRYPARLENQGNKGI